MPRFINSIGEGCPEGAAVGKEVTPRADLTVLQSLLSLLQRARAQQEWAENGLSDKIRFSRCRNQSKKETCKYHDWVHPTQGQGAAPWLLGLVGADRHGSALSSLPLFPACPGRLVTSWAGL